MKFVNVGSHSWACIGGGDDVLHSYGANQGFVVNRQPCFVVDSGFHYRTANQVLRQVGRFRPKQVSFLTLTSIQIMFLGMGFLPRRGSELFPTEIAAENEGSFPKPSFNLSKPGSAAIQTS